jgi:hypothetical protein
VEELCASHYAVVRGRPSLPPGRYFRMLLMGYFEGIDCGRGLEWRYADSPSLREFLRLVGRETVPDPWLSRTRSRLLATSGGAMRPLRSISLTFSRGSDRAAAPVGSADRPRAGWTRPSTCRSKCA